MSRSLTLITNQGEIIRPCDVQKPHHFTRPNVLRPKVGPGHTQTGPEAGIAPRTRSIGRTHSHPSTRSHPPKFVAGWFAPWRSRTIEYARRVASCDLKASRSHSPDLRSVFQTLICNLQPISTTHISVDEKALEKNMMLYLPVRI